MKKIAGFVPFVFAVVFLVACGDDDSSFATRPSDDSSSSICEDCDDASSSSVKSSSSSVKSSSSAKSSSSSAKSSSSSSEESSSSNVIQSSRDASDYDASANTLTDLRDGQVYRTVTIDRADAGYTEVWMAENLNYETANSWCGGGNGSKEGNCSFYGRLYTWTVAIGKDEEECGYRHECNLGEGPVRGVCPKGWHLPSKDEWNALIMAVDGFSTTGYRIKSASGWSEDGNGLDDLSFSALPAGLRYESGEEFCYRGTGAFFWSSTESDSDNAYDLDLYYAKSAADLFDSEKVNGLSVRCVKD